MAKQNRLSGLLAIARAAVAMTAHFEPLGAGDGKGALAGTDL